MTTAQQYIVVLQGQSVDLFTISSKMINVRIYIEIGRRSIIFQESEYHIELITKRYYESSLMKAAFMSYANDNTCNIPCHNIRAFNSHI